LPPTLVVQGNADENVQAPVTEQVVAAYELAGGIIELEMFTGMAHGFGSNPIPEKDRTVGLMKKFLSRSVFPGEFSIRVIHLTSENTG